MINSKNNKYKYNSKMYVHFIGKSVCEIFICEICMRSICMRNISMSNICMRNCLYIKFNKFHMGNISHTTISHTKNFTYKYSHTEIFLIQNKVIFLIQIFLIHISHTSRIGPISTSVSYRIMQIVYMKN